MFGPVFGLVKEMKRGGAISCPYFANMSSKRDHFYWFCPQWPAKTPPYLGLSDIFIKKAHFRLYYIVLRWTMVPGEKPRLISKRLALKVFFQKMANIGQNDYVFWSEHCRVWDEVWFLPGELLVYYRTTNISEFFWKKPPAGQDMYRNGELISGILTIDIKH